MSIRRKNAGEEKQEEKQNERGGREGDERVSPK
jgi:hypothetical protein